MARRCLDQVRISIGSEVWNMGVCSVWERVRLAICALTLGDGCLGPFGLLKFYCKLFTLRDGVWAVGFILGY